MNLAQSAQIHVFFFLLFHWVSSLADQISISINICVFCYVSNRVAVPFFAGHATSLHRDSCNMRDWYIIPSLYRALASFLARQSSLLKIEWIIYAVKWNLVVGCLLRNHDDWAFICKRKKNTCQFVSCEGEEQKVLVTPAAKVMHNRNWIAQQRKKKYFIEWHFAIT